MAYIVLAEVKSEELQKKVDQHRKDGWSLQGGIAIAYAYNGNTAEFGFAQALIRDIR